MESHSGEDQEVSPWRGLQVSWAGGGGGGGGGADVGRGDSAGTADPIQAGGSGQVRQGATEDSQAGVLHCGQVSSHPPLHLPPVQALLLHHPPAGGQVGVPPGAPTGRLLPHTAVWLGTLEEYYYRKVQVCSVAPTGCAPTCRKVPRKVARQVTGGVGRGAGAAHGAPAQVQEGAGGREELQAGGGAGGPLAAPLHHPDLYCSLEL